MPILTWLIFVLGISSSTIINITNEQVELATYAQKQAIENGVDPAKFVRLIECESKISYREGDFNPDTGLHESKGILQFQKKTWDRFSRIYKIKDPYPGDSHSQIRLAARMLGDNPNHAYHWWYCSKYKAGFVEEEPIYRKK